MKMFSVNLYNLSDCCVLLFVHRLIVFSFHLLFLTSHLWC